MEDKKYCERPVLLCLRLLLKIIKDLKLDVTSILSDKEQTKLKARLENY